MIKKHRFHLLFLVLVIGILACQMSSNLVPDFEPIAVRTEDAVALGEKLAVSLDVDTENNLLLEFEQAQIGPFPLPKMLLDTIGQEVKKTFMDQVANLGEGYIIEEISMGEGSILIRGTKK